MLQASSLQEVPKRRGGVTGKGWMPGQSGNPKGRSGERRFKGKTLAELARSMTHEALQVVGEVLTMPNVPPALRLQAADIILRRGWGDAPRADPHALPDGITFVVRPLVASVGPIPGVIASPIKEHVWIPGNDPRLPAPSEQRRGFANGCEPGTAYGAVSSLELPIGLPNFPTPGGE